MIVYNLHANEMTYSGKVTIHDFLATMVGANQLCVICNDGYIVDTVWVDPEDMFISRVHEDTKKQIVKSTRDGYLPILLPNGSVANAPALVINCVDPDEVEEEKNE